MRLDNNKFTTSLGRVFIKNEQWVRNLFTNEITRIISREASIEPLEGEF